MRRTICIIIALLLLGGAAIAEMVTGSNGGSSGGSGTSSSLQFSTAIPISTSTPAPTAGQFCGIDGTGAFACFAVTGDSSCSSPSAGSISCTNTAMQKFPWASATPASAAFPIYSGTTWTPHALSGGVSVSTGGVVTMNGVTGAPMWARSFGNGVDGAGPANGAISTAGERNYTSWHCTGAITNSNTNVSLIVRSQGTVNLDTGCSIAAHASNGSGDLGGAGGSGGSGAANSSASSATGGSASNVTFGTPNGNKALSAGALASSSGPGNDGGAITTDLANLAFSLGYPFIPTGGGIGTAGGSSGGAAGNGGNDVIIIAPTITIASGVTIDVSGNPGVAPTANSTGAGGGGGGGTIWLLSQSFTDNGGIYKYGGGPGGAITAPSIQATGGGCNTTGCGKDAAFTITGLTAGGLDASKITISNAGSGYQTAPDCKVNAGASGLTGSPACHFTISGGAVASVVIDTAGSGGTLTTFTTAFIGGYGANGMYQQQLIQ